MLGSLCRADNALGMGLGARADQADDAPHCHNPIYICVCMYVRRYLFMYLCIYVCTYACTYVYMYV